jgi:cyclophilin family peptidyl-prolyl cis-trans isomerase
MNLFRRFTLTAVLILIVALAAGNWPAHAQPIPQAGSTPDDLCAAVRPIEPETRAFKQAENVLQDGVDYWAIMCTDTGAIYFDLFEAAAPITVNNFVFLAQQGYYNLTTFHRVLPGFMAQGGDPTGTGSGGPGYEFEDETDNGLIFDRFGLLAMANAGPNTNGSQFFVTFGQPDWLNGNHTIFGQVYQGMDAAEMLLLRDPQESPAYDGAALYTVLIVDDPASVTATPDGPPGIEHFQNLMEKHIADRLAQSFTLAEEYAHTYDAAAEAESWREDGGDALVDYMAAYLSDHGFIGTAAILMPVNECPPNPADLPIWAIGFQVSDYGAADAAQGVVSDDARADRLVGAGAYEAYTDPEGINGRLFSRALPEEGWCGPNGMYYRLEVPYGRYLLTADLIVDAEFINDSSEPTAAQYMGFVTDDILIATLGTVLDRGNATE